MTDEWRQRALRERARAERAEKELETLRGIEGREISARIMARRFWRALSARKGWEAEALFTHEILRIVDPAFDAAMTVWERHRVHVEPCRRGFDETFYGWLPSDGAYRPDAYLGIWPDGSKRNLTRDQLMMMGGLDPEAEDAGA